MELFLKAAAGAMLTLVLILTVGKQEKDIALLLGICGCCMLALPALNSLRPVLDFLYRLEAVGNLRVYGLGTLLKMVGVGLISELVAGLCQDAGNGSLGKQVQLLGTAVILRLSLPLLETLLDLMERLLGEL